MHGYDPEVVYDYVIGGVFLFVSGLNVSLANFWYLIKFKKKWPLARRLNFLYKCIV